jgi:hypothetical protein
MPTHPDILTELAIRYGDCDASSEEAIDAFYTHRFPKLPRRIRERIGFEVLHRDGESEPVRRLSPTEISQLDRLFQTEGSAGETSARKRWVLDRHSLMFAQAGFSAAVFILLIVMPVVVRVGHVAETILPLIGLIGNAGALLYDKFGRR